MNVRFIDTSIMTNILDIPHMNQNREEVIKEFNNIPLSNTTLLLPLSTIIETGNHIAHINDGNVRRQKAELFSYYLLKTVNKQAPWSFYGNELTEADIRSIAADFPSQALKQVGIGDLCIIQHYNT